MKTFQDLEKVIDNEKELKLFLITAMNEYVASDEYKLAQIAEDYDKQQNTTIMGYQKWLYTVSGNRIPDVYSANHKLASNYYNRFNVQENQYLLGNGVTFNDENTKSKLGTKKYAFDTMLQKLGKLALTHKKAYGFWNKDHINVFSMLEFYPFLDEENGAIMAGIRFWQIDKQKPLRITFYEMDGYTQYIKHKEDSELQVLVEKKPYILDIATTEHDGEEVYNGRNYEGFPIVPLWGNQDHVCKIQAWRSKIDAYDLISSGFCNDVDEAVLYWTISNAGGMEKEDLADFLQQLKTIKVATTDDDTKIDAHTVDIPVNARETYLKLLEKDLYKDAMALDTEAIAEGNTVATAIRAAYEPLNAKTDDYEYCVIEFVQEILALAGIDDEPSFKRSTVVNQSEETQMVLSAAQYLDDETILKKLPFISSDEVQSILDKRLEEEADRFGTLNNPNEGEE